MFNHIQSKEKKLIFFCPQVFLTSIASPFYSKE